MQRWILAFGLVCLMAGAAAAQSEPLSGRRAPGFSLMDINYNQHDLADYRGKVVLIDFMRTDCPTCNAFAGVTNRIRERFGDAVAVLTIVNAPPDSLKTVGEFIERHNLRSPVLFDTFQVAASYMKLSPVNPQFALPHLFLIDSDGQIQKDIEYDGENDKYFTGQAEPLMAELDAMVKKQSPGRKRPGAAKKE